MAAVSGTVKDSTGAFASRLVRVYRRDTGAFVGECLSNSVTGAWAVPTTASVDHFAVVHADSVDPYANNVALDLVMEGYPGQTVFADTRGHAVTRNGDTVLSATKAKSGVVSGYFDGTGDYLSIANSVDFNIGSGSATISAWVNTTLYDASYTRGIVFKGTGLQLGLYLGCISTNGYNGGTRIDNGAWHHLQVCVDATNQYTFVDGSLLDTRARPAITDNTNAIIIGNYSPIDANRYFQGYIDMVNYAPGVCRNTTSFTPPTHPHFVSVGAENALIFDNLTPV